MKKFVFCVFFALSGSTIDAQEVPLETALKAELTRGNVLRPLTVTVYELTVTVNRKFESGAYTGEYTIPVTLTWIAQIDHHVVAVDVTTRVMTLKKGYAPKLTVTPSFGKMEFVEGRTPWYGTWGKWYQLRDDQILNSDPSTWSEVAALIATHTPLATVAAHANVLNWSAKFGRMDKIKVVD